MDSKNILYSKGRNDECLTPTYGVKILCPYIPNIKTIWSY